MTKRPTSIIVIAVLYIATGTIALVAHLTELTPGHPFESDILWASLVNIAAIVAGAFLFRGHNWARWLALAWIAFHVILSISHSYREVAIHSLFCAAVAFFLFRPKAAFYFRSPKTQETR